MVAIDGPGGSGRSFLADAVAQTLAAAGASVFLVHVDDFYLPSSHRVSGTLAEQPIGANYDWGRLRDQVLLPIRRGKPAGYDRYDWNRDALVGTCEVPPSGVVIVEGIYASRQELAHLYDLRVWVECPRELRLTRGLARDGEGARLRWEQDWMQAEDRYIEQHRPQHHADLVVSGAPV